MLSVGVEVLGFDFEDRPRHQVLVERVERLEPGGDGTNLRPRQSGQVAVRCAGACDGAAGAGGSDEEAVCVAEHVLASEVVDQPHGGGEEEASTGGDQGGDDRVEPLAGFFDAVALRPVAGRIWAVHGDLDWFGVFLDVEFDADSVGDGVGGDLLPELDRIQSSRRSRVAVSLSLLLLLFDVTAEFHKALDHVVPVWIDPILRVPGDVECPEPRLRRARCEANRAQDHRCSADFELGGDDVGEGPPLRRAPDAKGDADVPRHRRSALGVAATPLEAGSGGESVAAGLDQDEPIQFVVPDASVEDIVNGDLIDDGLNLFGVLFVPVEGLGDLEPPQPLQYVGGGVLGGEVHQYTGDRDAADAGLGPAAAVGLHCGGDQPVGEVGFEASPRGEPDLPQVGFANGSLAQYPVDRSRGESVAGVAGPELLETLPRHLHVSHGVGEQLFGDGLIEVIQVELAMLGLQHVRQRRQFEGLAEQGGGEDGDIDDVAVMDRHVTVCFLVATLRRPPFGFGEADERGSAAGPFHLDAGPRRVIGDRERERPPQRPLLAP